MVLDQINAALGALSGLLTGFTDAGDDESMAGHFEAIGLGDVIA